MTRHVQPSNDFRHSLSPEAHVERQEALFEDLALFEEFQRDILPALQEDIKKGVTAESMARKYQSHALARIITMALRERDSGKALAASKEILDRAVGKSTERRTIKHELESLDDKSLDSLIYSKMAEELE